MPYENEHACRLRNPGDFKDGSFRRTTRKHNGKEYVRARIAKITTAALRRQRTANRMCLKIWNDGFSRLKTLNCE
jgi:hypothetical protein